MTTHKKWIIAIDGGGTKCKASLFNANGDTLASATTGPANIFTNFDEAISSIISATKQVLELFNAQNKVHLQSADCILSAACAGAGIETSQRQFTAWKHPFKQALLTTDIHASCLAANNNKECALVIVGTGSCIAVYKEQVLKQYGGHGFLLGDQASGAWLGQKAISWFLRALESSQIKQQDIKLYTVLVREIGSDVSSIVSDYGRGSAQKFAALMPTLLEHKTPRVLNWLNKGCAYLTTTLEEYASQHKCIFIDGGLANVYRDMLSKSLNIVVDRPKNDACFGAFLHAIDQCH